MLILLIDIELCSGSAKLEPFVIFLNKMQKLLSPFFVFNSNRFIFIVFADSTFSMVLLVLDPFHFVLYFLLKHSVLSRYVHKTQFFETNMNMLLAQ